MATARATQRAGRDRNAVPSVAIAGYTNAGKSSLLNQLTGAGVLVENALFATLDPTVRRAQSPDGREYTLTDTVGFVRHLPHQLVDAFRSTLEEVAAADLLLHVVDGSDPDPLGQIDAVRVVLGEIDAAAVPEVIVVNKVDAMSEDDILTLRRALPGAAWVSARTGAGIDALRELGRRPAAAPGRRRRGAGALRPRRPRRPRAPRRRGAQRDATRATGTRLTARVDGALAAALEEFAAPVGLRARAVGRSPGSVRVTGRSRAGTVKPVTSGVVQDADAPARTRAVTAGRLPWWLVLGALVVGGLGHRRPVHPGLAGADGPRRSPRWSATGACRTRWPTRPSGLVTQLGGRVTILGRARRAGRLPGLAAAHAAAAGPRARGARAAHRRRLRDQVRHRPHRPGLPGVASSSTTTAPRSRRATSPTPSSCGVWPGGWRWSTTCRRACSGRSGG